MVGAGAAGGGLLIDGGMVSLSNVAVMNNGAVGFSGANGANGQSASSGHPTGGNGVNGVNGAGLRAAAST